MSRLVHITSSGVVCATRCNVLSVLLTAAGATSTISFDESDDGSGTDIFKMSAVANTSVSHRFEKPVPLSKLYGALTGASATATFEIETG